MNFHVRKVFYVYKLNKYDGSFSKIVLNEIRIKNISFMNRKTNFIVEKNEIGHHWIIEFNTTKLHHDERIVFSNDG